MEYVSEKYQSHLKLEDGKLDPKPAMSALLDAAIFIEWVADTEQATSSDAERACVQLNQIILEARGMCRARSK